MVNNTFNLNAICRGCLSDREETLRSIFDSSIFDIFVMCTNMQVSQMDDLPKNICSSCVYKSVSWYSFKQQCEQSDLILKNHLNYKKDDLPASTELEISAGQQNTINVDLKIDSSVLLNRNSKEDFQTTITITEEKDYEFTDNVEESGINDQESFNHSNEADNYLEIPNDDCEEETENYDKPISVRQAKVKTFPAKINQKNKKQFECSTCTKNFRNAERLEAHQRTHLGQKPEVCKICQKEFNNLRALRRHRLKHDDAKQFTCQECGKMYKYQTSLTLHKKVHQDIRRFICDLCGKSFVRAHGLQSHLLSHTTDTPFACELCGKSFKNMIMLRNHQMRHDGVKKFICSECGKSFATSAELTTHTRTHTGLKPFKCSMCDKSYKTKSHLAVHFRMHTGARPYACDLCPLKFAHNKVLKQHRLTHTGERPHICDICQRPFRQKSTLKVHMRTHKSSKMRELHEPIMAESPVMEPLSIERHIQQSINEISSVINLLDN